MAVHVDYVCWVAPGDWGHVHWFYGYLGPRGRLIWRSILICTRFIHCSSLTVAAIEMGSRQGIDCFPCLRSPHIFATMKKLAEADRAITRGPHGKALLLEIQLGGRSAGLK